MIEPYSLHKQSLKYYIIPTCNDLDVVPYPNKYLSFWFEYNAKALLSAMNAAWRDGYRVNSFFKD